jgi:hypothetical protein
MRQAGFRGKLSGRKMDLFVSMEKSFEIKPDVYNVDCAVTVISFTFFYYPLFRSVNRLLDETHDTLESID